MMSPQFNGERRIFGSLNLGGDEKGEKKENPGQSAFEGARVCSCGVMFVPRPGKTQCDKCFSGVTQRLKYPYRETRRKTTGGNKIDGIS
jgi:hypothetical protein